MNSTRLYALMRVLALSVYFGIIYFAQDWFFAFTSGNWAASLGPVLAIPAILLGNNPRLLLKEPIFIPLMSALAYAIALQKSLETGFNNGFGWTLFVYLFVGQRDEKK